MPEPVDVPAVEDRRASGSAAEDSPDRNGELLEGLLLHSLDAITLSDRASRRLLQVSESLCALTGYSREELIGRTATEVGLVGDDPQRAAVTANADRGRGGVYEVEIRCKDGTLRSVEISIQLLEGNELALTIIRDVTERQRFEMQLRVSEERFRAAIGALLGTFVILSPVRDDHGEIVDYRFEYANDAYCSLVSSDRDRLLGHAVGELFPAFPGSGRFALYRQVAVTGEPVTSKELIGEGAWAGTALSGRVFDTVITAMGENVIVSGREVTARWHAEQARAAAEARLHDVIESAPDAMVIVNAGGEIVLVNAQTEKLFGYAREELIGQDHGLLVPELLRDRHRGHRASYTADPRARAMGAHIELFARHKDGSEIPVEISLSPLRGENGMLVASAIRDVTARRHAEQELALRAELLDLAHDAVIVFEPSESRVRFWNREAQAVYGYSAAEAVGRVTHELLATVFPGSREAVAEALARDGQWSGELRHTCKEGREILVSSRQALQRDADGRALAIIELNSDITAQRQAEDELRASRARLTEAERIARIGSWERDLSDDSITFSDGMLAIYGLSADQFDGTFEAARRLINPDDQAHLRETIDRAIAERSSYSVEYRAIRADGRVRNLRSHGDVVVDRNGQPIRVVGVVQDVTDAKLTQEALQSTSAELARRANELQQLALRTPQEPSDIPHAPLTARQLEIMRLVAEGLTNAVIAERLFLAPGTVKWHISQILTKTNSRSRAEAIAHILGTPQ